MATLYIGDKSFSSWSLRPWLALRQSGIPFVEETIRLRRPDTRERILGHSPSGKVPCLVDGDCVVWDSLAICEYAAERVPALWPAEPAVRAEARAVAAEMHSGFAALRRDMPMDVRARRPGEGRTPESEQDIARIAALWESCRRRFAVAGPFLFGAFSIADAFYAPVVWRFRTYAVDLPPAARDWTLTMLALPAMAEWEAGALAEGD